MRGSELERRGLRMSNEDGISEGECGYEVKGVQRLRSAASRSTATSRRSENPPAEQSVDENKSRSVSAVLDRILKAREGANLGGLSIKDLIHEGRNTPRAESRDCGGSCC